MSYESLDSTSDTDEQSFVQNLPYCIALGASAGGLDALLQFLNAYTSDTDAFLVVAQHLDPKHPTILKDLLARATSLPIVLVTEDMRLKTKHVYIIGPGHHAEIEGNLIKLSPAVEIGPKPSIDYLLNSIAKSYKDRAIAVILSGTGTDGAQGITAIKAENGVVYAQQPKSAKFRGMPEASISTGIVDLILEPSEIAQEICELIHPGSQERIALDKLENRELLDKLFDLVHNSTGLDFSGYKLKTIGRRLERRLSVHRIPTIRAYIDYLMQHPKEIDHLAKDFLISVTEFFRDKQAFADLEKLIDDLVRNKLEGQTIRIWVAGCANGEEAFSIAILFHKAILEQQRNISFQIFATDVDEFALEKARHGLYSYAELKDLPVEIQDRYFQPFDERFRVIKVIRDRVVFARHNMISDPPFTKLDLISCRNVMIYFSAELQRKLMQTFHFALNPAAYLFLGRSESVKNNGPHLFEYYKSKSNIYVRKNADLLPKSDRVLSASNYAKTAGIRPTTSSDEALKSLGVVIEEILLDKMAPASVFVDRNGFLLHTRGNISDYLEIPQGKMDTNVLTLANAQIRLDLRVLLNKAKAEGEASSQSLFYNGTYEKEFLFLNVRKVEIDSNKDFGFLIVFMPFNAEKVLFDTSKIAQDQWEENKVLVNEVQLFKERLQASVQELEITNEEFQSTNEELQSANEELHSTNEELQTAIEELQSTNEELSTVNQELEIKTSELEEVNEDLKNVLDQIQEIVVVLDRLLRVERFTKSAETVLAMNNRMLMQTITTIGLAVDVANFREVLQSVMETNQSKVLKTMIGQDEYQIHIKPNLRNSGEVKGLMLFFMAQGDSRDLSNPL